MLQEPGTSQYDLRFNLLGFPVRVAWGFWLVAAILGWGWSDGVDYFYTESLNLDSPGAPALLLIWMLAVFVSILTHELGHSLAMRYYGVHSRIVLYHFGGLAIPDSFASWSGARQRHVGSREQIVISAAGPVIQLALAAVVWLIGLGMNIQMHESGYVNWLFGTSLGADAAYPGSAVVFGLFSALILPSTFWAILNLAPILPLDGGQILRNSLMLSNVYQPARTAHLVSVFAGAGLGLWFLSLGQPGGIMFLLFAATNWQALQHGSGSY